MVRPAMPRKLMIVSFAQNISAERSRNVQSPQSTPRGEPEHTIAQIVVLHPSAIVEFSKNGCCMGVQGIIRTPVYRKGKCSQIRAVAVHNG